VTTDVATLIDECLAGIAAERPTNFSRCFDLVERLVYMLGEADLARRLFDLIPVTAPIEVIGDLFGILIWSTSDNGSATVATAEAWLRENSDPRRMVVALSLGVFPFRDPVEMERVLADVAARHPELASRCSAVVASRARSNG
jgi:hypothetical protein